MAGKSNPTLKIEFEPDARARFERFVRDLAKAGLQHQKKTNAGKSAGRKIKRASKRS
jgi:hypothetical protein